MKTKKKMKRMKRILHKREIDLIYIISYFLQNSLAFFLGIQCQRGLFHMTCMTWSIDINFRVEF